MTDHVKPAVQDTAPARCAHCGHTDPHDGPSGDMADACTHPACRCAYFSPEAKAQEIASRTALEAALTALESLQAQGCYLHDRAGEALTREAMITVTTTALEAAQDTAALDRVVGRLQEDFNEAQADRERLRMELEAMTHEARRQNRDRDAFWLRVEELEKRLRALEVKWLGEAAVMNTFHATMGIGWKACAHDLAALLRAEGPEPQKREER